MSDDNLIEKAECRYGVLDDATKVDVIDRYIRTGSGKCIHYRYTRDGRLLSKTTLPRWPFADV